MIFFDDFQYTEYSFASRIGDPKETNDAIGQVIINFSKLEEVMSERIMCMLDLNDNTGHIICAELSFKQKLHIFSSLVQELESECHFNLGPHPLKEVLKELINVCKQAEDMRNTIVHSSWIYSREKQDWAQRKKVSAKLKRGLAIAVEPMDSGKILDIADYICYAWMMVDEFFIDFEFL